MARVDIHYFEQALRCAERQGYSRHEVLSHLDITLPNQTSSVDDQVMTRLVQHLWATLNDEFLGCTKQRCKLGTFPFMARHILAFPTLEQMLTQAIKFYHLVTDDVVMDLKVRGGVAELTFKFDVAQLDPGYFFREFWLIIWHRFSSWLIDKKIPLTSVSFNYDKPVHHQQLKLLFPCQHRFNRPCIKLAFSAQYLALPNVRTQAQLGHFLRHSPADLITIPGAENSVTAEVIKLILSQQQTEFSCPTFAQVAQTHNMSEQTLRRKLHKEGTSYPAIKDQIRRDLAVEHLMMGKLTIAQISTRVGFSEPRSFTRAFKQWTGQSPSKYNR